MVECSTKNREKMEEDAHSSVVKLVPPRESWERGLRGGNTSLSGRRFSA